VATEPGRSLLMITAGIGDAYALAVDHSRDRGQVACTVVHFGADWSCSSSV
jgi:hypothetical protein